MRRSPSSGLPLSLLGPTPVPRFLFLLLLLLSLSNHFAALAPPSLSYFLACTRFWFTTSSKFVFNCSIVYNDKTNPLGIRLLDLFYRTLKVVVNCSDLGALHDPLFSTCSSGNWRGYATANVLPYTSEDVRKRWLLSTEKILFR